MQRKNTKKDEQHETNILQGKRKNDDTQRERKQQTTRINTMHNMQPRQDTMRMDRNNMNQTTMIEGEISGVVRIQKEIKISRKTYKKLY